MLLRTKISVTAVGGGDLPQKKEKKYRVVNEISKGYPSYMYTFYLSAKINHTSVHSVYCEKNTIADAFRDLPEPCIVCRLSMIP